MSSVITRRASVAKKDSGAPTSCMAQTSSIAYSTVKPRRKRGKKASFLGLEILFVLSAAAIVVLAYKMTSTARVHIRGERIATNSYTVDLNGETTATSEQTVEEWEDFTARQIFDYLECDDYENGELPIRSQKTYKLMREIYYEVVGPDKSTIGPPSDPSNGFSHSIFVDQSPGKGRGVYAQEDIPEGALVWSNHRTAIFPNSWYYRRFLMKLPKDVACDVLQWTYIHDLGEGTEKRIMVDLDEGALCNDGEETDDADPNLGWDKELAAKIPAGNGMHFFALRDIEAGEELLCVYTEFSAEGEHDWARFGLDWEK